jgi:hypothetical protein
MSRVSGGISTRNPFGPNWGKSKAQSTGGSQTVGEQVQSELFGKKKPQVLDEDDADISRLMGRLHAFRKKLARLAGDEEEDYDLTLAAGTIAMIDDKGLIYVGKGFLLDYAENLDLQVGVLAHEIGHRPKRWNEYRASIPLTKEDKEKLCRLEETRADYFAGRALAELGLECDPVIAFLKAVSTQPHPEYFSAKLRAECIREGFDDGSRKANNRRKFFPELDRMHGAKGDLGVG